MMITVGHKICLNRTRARGLPFTNLFIIMERQPKTYRSNHSRQAKSRDRPKDKPLLLENKDKENQLIMPSHSRKSVGQALNSTLILDRENARSKSRQRKTSTQTFIKSFVGSFCVIHKDRTASFLVFVDSSPSPYCKNCAVVLAAKQLKVVSLPQRQQTGGSRKHEVSVFLKEIVSLRSQIESKKKLMTRRKSMMMNHYSSQMGRIQDYFQKMAEMLLQAKEQTLSVLEAARHKQLKLMEIYEEQLRDSQKEVDSMKNDVTVNLELVINEVNIQTYKKVMNAYQEKVKRTQNKISEISQLSDDVPAVQTTLLKALLCDFQNSIDSKFLPKMRKVQLKEEERSLTRPGSVLGNLSHISNTSQTMMMLTPLKQEPEDSIHHSPNFNH